MTTSAHPFPFRFLSSASLLLGFPPHCFQLGFLFLPLKSDFLSSVLSSLPDTQLPVLPFSSLPGFASQWLFLCPVSVFRLSSVFRFLPGWFPVRSLRFCLLSFSVRSLSPFPDSLPQPFLRCSSLPPPFGFLPDVNACLPLPFVRFFLV